jgi:hypothetical protein
LSDVSECILSFEFCGFAYIRSCGVCVLQAIVGAFGITGPMGTQATIASWAEIQNVTAIATSFYQC